jgi:hypothetical protein
VELQTKGPRKRALYVIVRKDLSRSAQAVQAGHALAQFLLEHKTPWSNGTLVYLGAADESHLNSVRESLSEHNMSEFKEPDMNNELTAIAVLGGENLNVSSFPGLRLL